ncbi:MAG: amidohydrolase [Caulobacteraceae bacterium]|nr:amidohydrolase [Caulobacteraceae bacterium]
MYDILIKGGRVVDGSGAPAYRADVALQDGRVAAVGAALPGGARRVIGAEGRIVAPGFIDPHTHFDVQLLWDGAARPALEPGWAGDVVVFDPDTIGRGEERPVFDMPGGGMRYIRDAVGIDTVVVNGEVAWTAGAYTDAAAAAGAICALN